MVGLKCDGPGCQQILLGDMGEGPSRLPVDELLSIVTGTV